MDYIVNSSSFSDNIIFPDGKEIKGLLGGAGLYALMGIKLWTDNVMIVCGVGEDYPQLFGKWFNENDIHEEGLLIKDKYTYQNMVRYFENGERIEEPLYGMEHRNKLRASPEELEQFCKNAKGVYVFKHCDSDYLGKLIEYRSKYGFKLMWEISDISTNPESLEEVKKWASQADIFSINRTEAFNLYSTDSEEVIVCRLKELGIPLVFLRLGEKGVVMITEGKDYFVPSMPNDGLVDVTGCGNCSSGAVLYAFCEGKDPVTSGLMANVAASYCFRQYGPYPKIDEATRKQAIETVEKYLEKEIQR